MRMTTLDAPDAHPVIGADAISLVMELTDAAWSLAGLPLPEYTRSETPYKFVLNTSRAE